MEDSGSKRILIGVLFALLAIIVFGLFWFFFLGGATINAEVGLGWYLFSFAAGLSMIVLPCTLPLAFIIVPLSMGKGVGKGFAIAVAFGIGVAITLSLYGVLAAAIGKVAIGTLGAPLEVVKNWLYFIAGAAAYLFALGELGLVRFHMPSYSGAFPGFIQKQQDVLKALLLGLFLGNIGVGCPHPATPVILTRIAVSGDIFYGWLLFFVHAIGRILPLIFLAILGIIGVNALAGLVRNKEKISRATGWGMVFVAAFILVLGLFSHDWWVLSGQHTFLEELTQEERFVGIISERLGVAPPHEHDLPPVSNPTRILDNLPLSYGTWLLLVLWIIPLFWYYVKKKKEITQMPSSPETQLAQKTLPYHFWNIVTLSILLVVVFGYTLPTRFLHRVEAVPMMEEKEMGAHMGEALHGGSFYHEAADVQEGLTVDLKITPESDEKTLGAGTPARLSFFVNEKPEGTPVTDLQIEHDKYMHVIGVRDDLNEFFHIHPEQVLGEDRKPTPGLWSVLYTFPKPGTYKVWTDITRAGETHSFGHSTFAVEGDPFDKLRAGGPRSGKQITFGNNVIVDKYQVALEYDSPIPVGHEHDISFDVHDLFGGEVLVEPYLAADMHLTAISDDLKHYVHTHPEGAEGHMGYNDDDYDILPIAYANGVRGGGAATGEDEHISFSIIFPEPGIYKLFAQFRPKGIDLPKDEALTASFYVKAEEVQAVSLGISPWWRNLVVSVLAIVVLSWIVKKFITVPIEVVKK